MSACAAFGCTNRPQKKVHGITFHKFPNDATLRNEWLLAIRRVNFRPSKYSRLCSEHFSEDQIDRTSLACVRLRANAVPNIFQGYPKNLQKYIETFVIPLDNLQTAFQEKYRALYTEEAFNCLLDLSIVSRVPSGEIRSTK
ncbi:THAP-type domain-containing protein [Trichonephila clavipes]|nr:THAP-type domain-containing protein [Trichonephila clavipes]